MCNWFLSYKKQMILFLLFKSVFLHLSEANAGQRSLDEMSHPLLFVIPTQLLLSRLSLLTPPPAFWHRIVTWLCACVFRVIWHLSFFHWRIFYCKKKNKPLEKKSRIKNCNLLLKHFCGKIIKNRTIDKFSQNNFRKNSVWFPLFVFTFLKMTTTSISTPFCVKWF